MTQGLGKYDRDNSQLTPREAEVVALQAQGLLPAQIAEQLGISASAVKRHLHSAKIRGMAKKMRQHNV